jgi:triacylglycerol lipase
MFPGFYFLIGMVYAINIVPFHESSQLPQPIDRNIYNNMFTYAHLIDISYCISRFGRIEEPFKCELQCEETFPNVSLVYQWYFDDAVCGYIAITYSNIFNYSAPQNSSEPKKTIIVSLRGTRSIFDTITDTKIEMTPYNGGNNFLPDCGPYCKVHRGFYAVYRNTLSKIDRYLSTELDFEDNYELIFLGHSMGGSVALLLALHYYDLGWDDLSLITMGQPLTGNVHFTRWVDLVMGSSNRAAHDSFSRKFLRIIHKDDVVTTIPKSTSIWETYQQFDNQIYLNCSSSVVEPTPDQVVDCFSADNENCIRGDFGSGHLWSPVDSLYENHNTYFRRLGMCGISI